MRRRDLPVVSPRKGSVPVDMLELAEQFHHRPDHAAAGPEHRVRGVRVLRGVLRSVGGVDVFRCSRDQGPDAGADGPCVQGQFERRGAVTQACY
jgi:hypothetical protein